MDSIPLSLNEEDKARFVVDMFTKIVVHDSFWFPEVRHQMGMEKTLEVFETATKTVLESSWSVYQKFWILKWNKGSKNIA
jgi:hypothetical protein